jgi:pSer/pThr/pTyr-binding forkhead associated (FHA) protein
LAWFAIVEGRRPGTIHRLNDGDTLLGRENSCDIFLDDDRTSSQHAKVKVERARGAEPGEERFVLYDLASSNGTFINGEPVLKQELKDGDRVKIGQSLLVFKRV